MNKFDFECKVLYTNDIIAGAPLKIERQVDMNDSNINSLINNLQQTCLDSGFGVRLLHEDGQVADKILIYVFPEDIAQNSDNAEKLSAIEDTYSIMLEETAQKRKPKRKAEDLPDPTQSPKAWVNQKDYSLPNPTYSTKISPAISTLAKEFREQNDLSKKDMTEQALSLYMHIYNERRQ